MWSSAHWVTRISPSGRSGGISRPAIRSRKIVSAGASSTWRTGMRREARPPKISSRYSWRSRVIGTTRTPPSSASIAAAVSTTSRRQIGRSWKSPTSARCLGGSRCVSAPPMTSGSKSVLFGIRSISSRAVVDLPAPNAPLTQTITFPPLLFGPLRLARSTLPRKPAPPRKPVPGGDAPPWPGPRPARTTAPVPGWGTDAMPRGRWISRGPRGRRRPGSGCRDSEWCGRRR